MKPADIKPSVYFDFNEENNKKGPKSKVGDHVRKYWSEENFMIKTVKNTFPLTYVISDLKGEEIIGSNTKAKQKKIRVEKVIKRKGDKLYVKWKGYDNSFNSWIDKKRHSTKLLEQLESKVAKLGVDKLVPVPADLSKLSDVVKNDVVKKDVCNAKINDTEDKIPDVTNLAFNTTLNAKVNK